MIYLAGLVAVVVFALALERSGIPRVAADAIETSRNASGLIRDRTLSDDEKEKAVRLASSSLFRSFFSIGIRGILALGLSFLTVVVFDLAGLASIEEVTVWLAKWEVVVSITAVVAIWLLIRRKS